MSIVTALVKRQPTIGGYQFDAVLESTLDLTADVTSYPMESGARATDHVIINPIKYTMTIMASNNPLRPNVTDLIGGFLSNYINLPTIAGLSAGFLSGRSDTHAGAVLTALVQMMVERQELDIYGGDIELSNMVIISISRVRNTENENGLEAVIELQELPRLELISGDPLRNPVKTANNDQARTSAGKHIHRGFAKVRDTGEALNYRASLVFDKATGAL